MLSRQKIEVRDPLVSNALDHMIQALDLEITAIRKRGSSQQLTLRGGERTGEVEGGSIYQFPLAEDVQLRDDTPVRVVVRRDEANGTVVSVKDGILVVHLDKDLGPKIPTAQLIADDSFLVERLEEKLEKIRSGEASFQRDAAERVRGAAVLKRM
jgi:hypothetical protein